MAKRKLIWTKSVKSVAELDDLIANGVIGADGQMHAATNVQYDVGISLQAETGVARARRILGVLADAGLIGKGLVGCFVRSYSSPTAEAKAKAEAERRERDRNRMLDLSRQAMALGLQGNEFVSAVRDAMDKGLSVLPGFDGFPDDWPNSDESDSNADESE